MKNNLSKICITASIAIGLGIATTSTAQAGTITGVTVGGTAASDYLVYGTNGNNTVIVPNSINNVNTALIGNSSSPGGNVELRAGSEQAGFDFTKNTTLTGQIGGQQITLSSLTASDWLTSNYKNSGLTFGQFWFNSALTANGFGGLVGTPISAGFFNAFKNNGGFQRFSDPNISYVNQNDTTGEIKIGLAGHLNATPMLLPYLDSYINSLPNSLTKAQLLGFKQIFANTPTQASEIVKYTYNGTTDYLFSFTGTNSGLVSNDGTNSHNANFEVSLAGVPPARTPEPSMILGLVGVIGAFKAQQKLKKSAS
ncbi:MAG: PEP-CTERM sorting domain-containing protein [Nostocales cyanobacterium]|nr:MAG: PEP-CTERM sorting domain-containing protein [Nostocales cyanobacterium]TAF17064.1 MAG: PEP-CTERM sorting domain-containing protein [Nostocales cyanobacterium]